MKGSEIQQGIIDLARTHQWKVAHFPSMRGHDGFWRTPVKADGKGWPDLFLIRRGQIGVIEVKGDGDKVREEQQVWLDCFAECPGVAFSVVVTSKDWMSGAVEKLLR